jgi:hypothetical protein
LEDASAHLEHLSLGGCTLVTDVGVGVIARSCRYLRTLCVRQCRAVSDMLLTTLAQYCTQLEALDVSRCASVTDDGLAALAAGCHVFCEKPLAESLTKRKATIMGDIEAATKIKESAEERLAEYEEKFWLAGCEDAEGDMLEEEPAGAMSAETDKTRVIIDSGATHSIMDVKTAENLQQQGMLLKVTPAKKVFRVANGQRLVTSSRATFRLPMLGETSFYVLEPDEGLSAPTLLGLDELSQATLNMSEQILYRGSEQIRLERANNGHLVVQF